MAITNVSELSAVAIDFLNRDDIAPVIGMMIDQADRRILADPRSRGEMTQQLLIKTRGPDDNVNPLRLTTKYYLDLGGVYKDNITYDIDDPSTWPTEEATENDTYGLEVVDLYINDERWERVHFQKFSEAEKNEKVYTIVGGNVYLNGWTDEPLLNGEEFTFKALVFKKEPLDNTLEDPTSELLRSIPDVYLYATLVEASIYLRDVEGIAMYQARYEELMDKLYKDYKRKQVSSGWSVSSIGGDY